MSPHVGNFVQDLVEMAKATEELPKVQAELALAKAELAKAQETIQSRELRIIDLKTEVDEVNAKLRSTEVARDDAELRFLELDEKASKAISLLGQIQGLAVQAEIALTPLKPEPVPMVPTVAEPVSSWNNPPSLSGSDTGQSASGQVSGDPTPDPIYPAPQGQSEPDPISTTTSEPAVTGQGDTLSSVLTEAHREPPYKDKFYKNFQRYIPLSEWLEGGGTELGYYA